MRPKIQPIDNELVQFFGLSRDLFCIAGFDGYFKHVNRAFERTLGYSKEELLARPFLDICHPDDVESCRTVLAELALGHNIVGFETRVICADGSMLWLEWNTSTRPEEGIVYGAARDTTERRLVDAKLNALHRVSTLVARGVRPAEIFSAVSEELDRLFGLDEATVGRFDPDGPAFVVVGVAKSVEGIPLGSRCELNDLYVTSKVFRTGRSARVDANDLASIGGPTAATLRRLGFICQVASPILVEGRLWGAVTVVSKDDSLPSDTEERLEKFTELVATAIANADSQDELAGSRRRLVTAADEARRRIERDLHDGTQQRLVSLALVARSVEADLPPDRSELRAELSRIATGLSDAVEDLQEISRGIHPAILSHGGLGPALRSLARRSTVPVELDIATVERFPEPIEVAAYFVASEALANAAKHAQASHIEVSLATRDSTLLLSIQDDGVGGADPALGSGLVGLADRVETLDGSTRIRSRAGGGTQITAEIPLKIESAEDAE